MKEIKFDQNKLITSEFEVEFEHNIDKVEFINDIYLVLIEIPKGSKEVDNLFGVNLSGNIIWRVQSVSEVFDISQNSPYVALKVINNQKAEVISFFGIRFSVNISNGKLIDKECIGW